MPLTINMYGQKQWMTKDEIKRKQRFLQERRKEERMTLPESLHRKEREMYKNSIKEYKERIKELEDRVDELEYDLFQITTRESRGKLWINS